MKTFILTLIVAALLLVGCSGNDSADNDPAGDGATRESTTPGLTDTSSDGSNGEDSTDDGSGDRATSSTAAGIGFDLPDGWEADSAASGGAEVVHLYRTDNAAVEAQLVADHPDADLSIPFIDVASDRSNSLMISLSGETARSDAQVAQMANVVVAVSEIPVASNTPWTSTDWTTHSELRPFAEFNYPSSQPTEIEVAGQPAFRLTAPAVFGQVELVDIIYAIWGPGEVARIEIFPNNSVHDDEVDAILDSLTPAG